MDTQVLTIVSAILSIIIIIVFFVLAYNISMIKKLIFLKFVQDLESKHGLIHTCPKCLKTFELNVVDNIKNHKNRYIKTFNYHCPHCKSVIEYNIINMKWKISKNLAI